MDKEKIVVILLLITIILSIGSVIISFSLNVDKVPKLNINSESPSANSGNVALTIQKLPIGGVE